MSDHIASAVLLVQAFQGRWYVVFQCSLIVGPTLLGSFDRRLQACRFAVNHGVRLKRQGMAADIKVGSAGAG